MSPTKLKIIIRYGRPSKGVRKSLFQGTIDASDLEDNMCESRGITLQLYLNCSCWGCKYRIQILCSVHSLSDPISHIMSHRLSETTELIVLMVTNSGTKDVL